MHTYLSYFKNLHFIHYYKQIKQIALLICNFTSNWQDNNTQWGPESNVLQGKPTYRTPPLSPTPLLPSQYPTLYSSSSHLPWCPNSWLTSTQVHSQQTKLPFPSTNLTGLHFIFAIASEKNVTREVTHQTVMSIHSVMSHFIWSTLPSANSVLTGLN